MACIKQKNENIYDNFTYKTQKKERYNIKSTYSKDKLMFTVMTGDNVKYFKFGHLFANS